MAKFEPNKPQITEGPTITVDAGLPVGRHRFQLVVEDDAGQRSAPAETVVTIQERRVGGPGDHPGGPVS
jgi:hypothetical protein